MYRIKICSHIRWVKIICIFFLNFCFFMDYANAVPFNKGYLHGYKGYAYHHLGYKQYKDGWWYPKEAFIKSKTLISVKKIEKRLSAAHKAYCRHHYRSYDEKTDTYQPYHGKRKICVSP